MRRQARDAEGLDTQTTERYATESRDCATRYAMSPNNAGPSSPTTSPKTAASALTHDKFDRHGHDGYVRETVMVDATDYWKWIGDTSTIRKPASASWRWTCDPLSIRRDGNHRDCPRKRPADLSSGTHRTLCV